MSCKFCVGKVICVTCVLPTLPVWVGHIPQANPASFEQQLLFRHHNGFISWCSWERWLTHISEWDSLDSSDHVLSLQIVGLAEWQAVKRFKVSCPYFLHFNKPENGDVLYFQLRRSHYLFNNLKFCHLFLLCYPLVALKVINSYCRSPILVWWLTFQNCLENYWAQWALFLLSFTQANAVGPLIWTCSGKGNFFTFLNTCPVQSFNGDFYPLSWWSRMKAIALSFLCFHKIHLLLGFEDTMLNIWA